MSECVDDIVWAINRAKEEMGAQSIGAFHTVHHFQTLNTTLHNKEAAYKLALCRGMKDGKQSNESLDNWLRENGF